MKHNISIPEYVNKISQLVYLAEINFLVCQKIYKDYLNEKGRHENTFFVLTANNAFYESLSVLQTLICSTEKNDLRIKPTLEKVIDSNKKYLVSVDSKIESQFIESTERNYPFGDESTLYGFQGDVRADIKRKKGVESGLADFQALKTKFEKFGFHKIQHHQIGHKHQYLKEPAGSADLLLQNSYLDNLEDIIKDLKIKTYFWFDFPFRNPNDSILYSLDEILKKF